MTSQKAGSSSILRIFRFVAKTEGVSYLTLLGIAMPIKYAAGIPEAVIFIGWAHGILFIAYMAALLRVQLKFKWPFKKFFLAGCASIIPFGPFIFDKKFFSELSEPENSSKY